MSYNNLSPVATIEVLKFAISLFEEVNGEEFKQAIALAPWDASTFVREERSVNVDTLFVVRDSANLQVYSWNARDAAQYAAVKAREGKKVAILALQEVTNSMRVYDDLQQELQLHEMFGMPDWVWRDLTWGRSDDWSGFGDEDLAWQITQEVAHLRDTSWWMAYRDNATEFAVEGLPWGACNNLE